MSSESKYMHGFGNTVCSVLTINYYSLHSVWLGCYNSACIILKYQDLQPSLYNGMPVTGVLWGNLWPTWFITIVHSHINNYNLKEYKFGVYVR